MKPQTFAEITPEQVSEWKQKFPKLMLVRVPLDEEEEHAQFYVRRPSVAQMRAITAIAVDKKKGALEANDSLRETLILGGDMKWLQDDCDDASVSIAVMEEIGELVSQKKATSKQV